MFAHYIYSHRNFPLTEINPNFKFTGTYPIHNFQAQYIHTFSRLFDKRISRRLRLGECRTTWDAQDRRVHRVTRNYRYEGERTERTTA